MASASTLPSLYQGVEKGSFGYKMLATMGWKEGQGLGANKQGIIEHVKVKKKQDALGVGAAEHVHKLRDWTTGMVGFDAILTGLKEISRAPHSSSSSSDHGSSSNEGHESGYASDSDTSVEVQKNSSKIAAAAAVGFKGGYIRKDSPLNKKQKKRKLGAFVASDSVSKRKAKELNSNKKRKKAGATPAAGKSSTTSKQTASAAAAAAASNVSDTSSSESDSDADSDPSSQPAAAAAVRPNNSTGKAATHLGRYQKREKAKTVRNYSAIDLAAILGLPGSAPGAPTAEGAAGWTAAAGISNPNGAAASSSSSSDDSGSSGDRSESDHDSSDQRLRPTTPPGSDTPPVRVSVSQQRQGLGSGSSDSPDPAAAAEDAVTGSSGSWWRSVFVRADRGAGNVIGSVGRKRINVSGFLEEDQTNLYMQAHEAAVKNKQGLGRSAMPKNVAGARWQGKKTKLGSDSEDEQPQQQQQVKKQQQLEQEEDAAIAAAGCKSYTKNGITIVMPIRRSQQQHQQIGGVQQQQQQQQIGGIQQQQQQRDGKQKRKQERDCNGSGVKVKHKAQQQQAAAESDKPAAAAAALATPSSRKKQKKSDQQRQVQHTAVKPALSAAAAAAAAGSRKVKWAKLAAKILEGAPKKRMRVQKLHKKVVAAAGYDVDAPGVDSEKLYQQMLGKLRKAEGLEVCDKYVAMA